MSEDSDHRLRMKTQRAGKFAAIAGAIALLLICTVCFGAEPSLAYAAMGASASAILAMISGALAFGDARRQGASTGYAASGLFLGALALGVALWMAVALYGDGGPGGLFVLPG